jgi:hypothetical protein
VHGDLEPVAKLTLGVFVWHAVSWCVMMTATGGLHHGQPNFAR